VTGSHFGSRRKYQNQGWLGTSEEDRRSTRVNFAKATRLANGLPQVSQSSTPTVRKQNAAKPPASAAQRTARCLIEPWGGEPRQSAASRGMRKIASL